MKIKGFLLIFGFLQFAHAFAQETQIRKSFYKELSTVYTIEGNDIFIRRIMTFPGKCRDELDSKVGLWLSNRIERRNSPEYINNADVTYRDYSYMFSERTPNFCIMFGFYSHAYYNLVVEIKEERIRMTAYITSYWWGENLPNVVSGKFYPFRKIGGGEKMLKLTAQHILAIFNEFDMAIKSDVPQHQNIDW